MYYIIFGRRVSKRSRNTAIKDRKVLHQLSGMNGQNTAEGKKISRLPFQTIALAFGLD
jgi:hypothetical protein